MVGLTHQNFLSAATGIVLAVALIRGFSRASMRTVGNFWVDVTRCTLYILLPICIVYTLFLVWQGIPQTLGAYVDATTLEGGKQTIAVGPVASQIAIKMLGFEILRGSVVHDLVRRAGIFIEPLPARNCRPVSPTSRPCRRQRARTPLILDPI